MKAGCVHAIGLFIGLLTASLCACVQSSLFHNLVPRVFHLPAPWSKRRWGEKMRDPGDEVGCWNAFSRCGNQAFSCAYEFMSRANRFCINFLTHGHQTRAPVNARAKMARFSCSLPNRDNFSLKETLLALITVTKLQQRLAITYG